MVNSNSSIMMSLYNTSQEKRMCQLMLFQEEWKSRAVKSKREWN